MRRELNFNAVTLSKRPPPTFKGAHMTNLQRTKKAQEDMGRMCGIVERFESNEKVKHLGVRSDLYEIFDLLSCSPGDGIIGVQACGSDFKSHYRKITIEKKDNALKWLHSNGKIELWGWRKLRSKKSRTGYEWQPRVVSITLNDFIIDQCEIA